MKRLSVDEVEYLAHALVKELMDYDEPIPEFGTRYPNKLEACLELPFQEFEGHKLYSKLGEKASILFYTLIKNHPFVNGNKRMAVAILLVWLFKNNYWIRVTNDKLYEIAIIVAKSKTNEKAVILASLYNTFDETIYKKSHPASRWFK